MIIVCRLSRRSGRIATAQKSPITTTGMYVDASSKIMTSSIHSDPGKKLPGQFLSMHPLDHRRVPGNCLD